MAHAHGKPNTPPIAIIPAQESHVPAIQQINAHWVQNTIIDFDIEAPTEAEIVEKLNLNRSIDLPWLVAVSSTAPQAGSEDNARKGSEEGECYGYALIHPFRGLKLGYAHVAELTIKLSPKSTGLGIGSILLDKLIEVIKEQGKIKEVLAVMAVDEEEWKDKRLKTFYESMGFIERGHLKRVGHKGDKWIDTRYMQLSL